MRQTLIVLGLAMAIGLLASPAWADSWAVLPFKSSGVDPISVGTFSELLGAELGSRAGEAFVPDRAGCQDQSCALAAAEKAGTSHAVYGAVGALGSKIVITATAVEVGSGRVLGSQRMTVDRVEDLEAVAARLAMALTGGLATEQTAELGSITKHESKPDVRRDGDVGLALRVGTIAPIRDGYARAGGGVLFDGSLWYETTDFAIEPRIGLRFNAAEEDGARYLEMPFDIGAYWLLGRSDLALLLGGGAGLRWINAEQPRTVHTGTIITTTHETTDTDQLWAFGAFGRVGVLLFRTYSVRVAVTADYNFTLGKLFGDANPQSLTFGIGVML